MSGKLPTLEFLRRQLDGSLPEGATTEMRYPTAISRTLGFRITRIDVGYARVELDANADLHGNQQGTVHGGMLCELAMPRSEPLIQQRSGTAKHSQASI